MWHSEYGQDRWLAENVFAGKRNGVFVEAGALDGLLHSNTLYFEQEMGWAGILIEANPFILETLKANRPEATVIGCALDGFERTDSFMAIDGGLFGWSALTGNIDPRRRDDYTRAVPEVRRDRVTVHCRPLAGVLRECGAFDVDFLSLDVEGSEHYVLQTFPFDEISIDVICVEDNFGDNALLQAVLIDNGYRHLARVGVDEMWEKASRKRR